MTIKSMCFLANPPTTTITKWKNINCNYTFDIMISWIILSLKTTSVFLTIYPFRYLPIICTSFFLALVTTLWKDTFLSSYNYIYIYIYIPIYLSIYLSVYLPVIWTSLSLAPGTTLWKDMTASVISSIIWTLRPRSPITLPESLFL